MQMKTFAEHPEITGAREVDLEERQQAAPDLEKNNRPNRRCADIDNDFSFVSVFNNV